MTEDLRDLLEQGPIVVQLAPYRERRRTRTIAAGILLGVLWATILGPALADLVAELLADLDEPSVGEGTLADA